MEDWLTMPWFNWALNRLEIQGKDPVQLIQQRHNNLERRFTSCSWQAFHMLRKNDEAIWKQSHWRIDFPGDIGVAWETNDHNTWSIPNNSAGCHFWGCS